MACQLYFAVQVVRVQFCRLAASETNPIHCSGTGRLCVNDDVLFLPAVQVVQFWCGYDVISVCLRVNVNAAVLILCVMTCWNFQYGCSFCAEVKLYLSRTLRGWMLYLYINTIITDLFVAVWWSAGFSYSKKIETKIKEATQLWSVPVNAETWGPLISVYMLPNAYDYKNTCDRSCGFHSYSCCCARLPIFIFPVCHVMWGVDLGVHVIINSLANTL